MRTVKIPLAAGAPKRRTFHGREWMEHARERWASLVNAKLEELGRDERVDHRSYERQGLDAEPGHHYGPAAAYMTARGIEHDKLDDAVAAAERQDQAQFVEQQIRALDSSDQSGGRSAMTHDEEEEHKPRQEYHRNGPSQLDDTIPGR